LKASAAAAAGELDADRAVALLPLRACVHAAQCSVVQSKDSMSRVLLLTVRQDQSVKC
jgi:hypothetical protein